METDSRFIIGEMSAIWLEIVQQKEMESTV